MARYSYSKTDYLRLAAEKNVDLVTTVVPFSTNDPVDWRCQFCNRVMSKSFRALRSGKYSCRCQNQINIKVKDCLDLAKEVGLTYATPDHVPVNSKEVLEWLDSSGSVYKFSYAQLKYRYNRK